MNDMRSIPANDRVAHVSLEGQVDAPRFVEGRMTMVQQPMANLLDAPGGNRTSQLLFGEKLLVLETRDGWSFGQSMRDRYMGYVQAGALTEPVEHTHWVAAPATHLYPKPDFKSPPDVSIFFGAQVEAGREQNGFRRIQTGHWVPSTHLQPMSARYGDPVGVADLLLGTPYLWGGCSRWGIDCSGLVQMALIACGADCPRDSDQQLETLGRDVGYEEPLQRGDLIFWEGHVGFMANDHMLLHANAYHMAVAYEPLLDAADRIEEKGEGRMLARRRLL